MSSAHISHRRPVRVFGSGFGWLQRKTRPNPRTPTAAASGFNPSTRKCSARRLRSLPLLNPSGPGTIATGSVRPIVPLWSTFPWSTRCVLLVGCTLQTASPSFLPHLISGWVGREEDPIRAGRTPFPDRSLALVTDPAGLEPDPPGLTSPPFTEGERDLMTPR